MPTRHALLPLAALIALAAGGCGGVDEEAEAPRVEEAVHQLGGATDAQFCVLVEPAYREELESGGAACTGAEEIASLRRDAGAELTDLSLSSGEEGAIESGALSFDGDTARVVVCPGGDCISDVGYYELALEQVEDRWALAGSEYHVEDF